MTAPPARWNSPPTAIWYRSGKPPVLIRWVLIRDPQGAFTTQALLCTDPIGGPDPDPGMVCPALATGGHFQEVRTHLGVETQRQWSDLAIARTTPVLLGLFSWTALALTRCKNDTPDPGYGGLVRQTIADLSGRHCPGPTPTVAGVGEFFTVGGQPRYAGTPSRSVPPTCRFPRLRRLNCAKSSLAPPSAIVGRFRRHVRAIAS